MRIATQTEYKQTPGVSSATRLMCVCVQFNLIAQTLACVSDVIHFLTKTVTWLILPVVICLSQRLSHACLSINIFIQWNCVQLIISVMISLMVPYYMDNRSNSRANTCVQSRLARGGMYLLDKKPIRATGSLVIHSNFSNRMALCWRCFIQISALSI